jgi:hypothetical protein
VQIPHQLWYFLFGSWNGQLQGETIMMKMNMKKDSMEKLAAAVLAVLSNAACAGEEALNVEIKQIDGGTLPSTVGR